MRIFMGTLIISGSEQLVTSDLLKKMKYGKNGDAPNQEKVRHRVSYPAIRGSSGSTRFIVAQKDVPDPALENHDTLVIVVDATQPLKAQAERLSATIVRAKELNYWINLCLTNSDHSSRVVSDLSFRQLAERWRLTPERDTLWLETTTVPDVACFAQRSAVTPSASAKESKSEIKSLQGVTDSLIAILKQYIVDRSKENANTRGYKIFSVFKYNKADKTNAAQFLVDLLEGNTPSGTLAQHQSALRQGELGNKIRAFAVCSGLGTVTNLLNHAQTEAALKNSNAPRPS